MSRGTNVLSLLPFVELDFNDSKQKKLYNFVVKTTRKVYDINSKISKTNDRAKLNILEVEKANLIESIQEAIKKVYEQDFR